MLTPKGNTSTKKAPGMQYMRYMRMEKIVRLELAHYSEADIAFHQGISVVRVNQIKRTPEYIALRAQIGSGLVSEADRQMFEDEANLSGMVRQMVPEALLAVRNAILNNQNPALQLKAAQDLLDREGTLAKVSRTEIKTKIEYDFDQHEDTANSLLAALKQNEAQRSQPSLEDLGLDQFAKAGLDKESQANLQRSLDMISAVILPGKDKQETIN